MTCIFDKYNILKNQKIDLSRYYEKTYTNIKLKDNKIALAICFHIGSKLVRDVTLNAITNIKNYVKNTLIIITISDYIYDEIIDDFGPRLKDMSNIIILKTVNRGFDIGGFYLSLYYLYQHYPNYKYCLKLHTKTDISWLNSMLSVFNNDFSLNFINFIIENKHILSCKKYNMVLDNRNSELIELILRQNNIKNFYKIIRLIYKNDNSSIDTKFIQQNNAFMSNIIHPKKYTPTFCKNNNIIYSKKLLKKLKRQIPFFPAGSIFMGTKELFDKLLEILPLSTFLMFEKKYTRNDSPTDNSYIHVIERFFGISKFLIDNY